MGRVVLVTGVAEPIASVTARRIAADPQVDKVIGVDVTAPHGDPSELKFVRADIRNPVIAGILAVDQVDTVLHMGLRAGRNISQHPGASTGTGTPRPGPGPGPGKETNVIDTLQLLAACQRAPGVRRLVLRSSTAVYGASALAPAMFSEDTAPEGLPRSGYAKDCSDVEGYVRGFGRRRPDVSLEVLRLADVLAGDLSTPLASYLRLPLVPTVLGFDPRLQLLHFDDAVGVLHRAVLHDVAGTFNVAGDGVLMLSQMVRRLGRPAVPVPGFGVGAAGRALQGMSRLDLSADLVALLTYGRVVDTTAMREQFGYLPGWSTAGTLDDFATAIGVGPLTSDRVRRVEQAVVAGLAGRV